MLLPPVYRADYERYSAYVATCPVPETPALPMAMFPLGELVAKV